MLNVHFTERARRIMLLANKEAQRYNHEYIGTEHILLGLIATGQGVGANVLRNLGIDLSKVRREVEKILLPGPEAGVSMGMHPTTPRVRKVIEYAIEEARSLKHYYVGSEHLLLGLLREDQGVAAQVLMNLGLTLPRIREDVINLVGDSNVEPQAAAADPNPNTDLQDLPEPVKAIAGEFNFQVEQLEQEREEAVGAHHWEKAAKLRDLIEKLKKLRDEFMRQWR
jgi:ATP-dependent Clp protease ATP-binding subunit ClpC